MLGKLLTGLLLILAPPAGSETARLELVAPGGEPLHATHVELVCPDASRRVAFEEDGTIALQRGWVQGSCALLVEAKEGSFGARLDPGIGQRERIVLVELSSNSPAASASSDTAGELEMEHAKDLPVGTATTRDFTAVVEVESWAVRDSAGISLAGTTSAEAYYGGDPDASTSLPRTATRMTAGAVDDVRDASSFGRFLHALGEVTPSQGKFTGVRTLVRVTDRHGRPIAGATIRAGEKRVRTRRDGTAVLIRGFDGLDPKQLVSVAAGGLQKSFSVHAGRTNELRLPVSVPPPRPALDVALVLDTTGSMGDELQYLQDELDEVLRRLTHRHSAVEIRWAIVLYRDDTDSYVTRTFDFTTDFGRFADDLAGQGADGGGDFPEAVDLAFEAANGLAWRDAGLAGRVVLHVGDAPPHPERLDDALGEVDRLRAEGTAIYPVAASGVDPSGEFFMRASALMSGGQYVFLTDDSGIGNPHREATAACFDVAALVDVLSKILDAEVAGVRPKLPAGTRCNVGSAAPTGHRSKPPQPLGRSLFDDDAASEHLGGPRVVHHLP